MNTRKRLLNSLRKVNGAVERRRVASATRIWIMDSPDINIFNYWWYRYFTNRLIVYLLDIMDSEQESKVVLRKRKRGPWGRGY